jgi:hypothetical protein
MYHRKDQHTSRKAGKSYFVNLLIEFHGGRERAQDRRWRHQRNCLAVDITARGDGAARRPRLDSFQQALMPPSLPRAWDRARAAQVDLATAHAMD